MTLYGLKCFSLRGLATAEEFLWAQWYVRRPAKSRNSAPHYQCLCYFSFSRDGPATVVFSLLCSALKHNQDQIICLQECIKRFSLPMWKDELSSKRYMHTSLCMCHAIHVYICTEEESLFVKLQRLFWTCCFTSINQMTHYSTSLNQISWKGIWIKSCQQESNLLMLTVLRQWRVFDRRHAW